MVLNCPLMLCSPVPVCGPDFLTALRFIFLIAWPTSMEISGAVFPPIHSLYRWHRYPDTPRCVPVRILGVILCLSPLFISPVAQMVRNLPAVQEIFIWSLGHKDPLEKGMATHSSILQSLENSTDRGPGRLQSVGRKVGHDWAANTCTFSSFSLSNKNHLNIPKSLKWHPTFSLQFYCVGLYPAQFPALI